MKKRSSSITTTAIIIDIAGFNYSTVITVIGCATATEFCTKAQRIIVNDYCTRNACCLTTQVGGQQIAIVS